MHMLICIIILPMASCSIHCLPVPACACLCHLYVRCSPDACLLAWHLKPVVVNMMLVQCALSPLAMLRLFKRRMTLSRLSMASWWTCCIPGITPPHPTELALMSTHSTDAAEGCNTEEQKQVGHCAAVPLLALDLADRAENDIHHCHPVVECYW